MKLDSYDAILVAFVLFLLLLSLLFGCGRPQEAGPKGDQGEPGKAFAVTETSFSVQLQCKKVEATALYARRSTNSLEVYENDSCSAPALTTLTPGGDELFFFRGVFLIVDGAGGNLKAVVLVPEEET